MAKIIAFIHTIIHRGEGTKDNPHRHVEQLWTMDGKLVAERDPHKTEAAFFLGSEPL